MIKYSTPLVIKELQIKTIVRYYFIPFRMAVTKNKSKISVGEDVEILEPLYIGGGNVKRYCYCGRQFGGSSSS